MSAALGEAQQVGGETWNIAGQDTIVALQAQVVRDSTIIQNVSGPTAAQKYRRGLRCFEDGIVGEALGLFGEALREDHDTADVRFHFALAMVSRRPIHDLSSDERRRIVDLVRRPDDDRAEVDRDDYSVALAAIRDLLCGFFGDGESDAAAAEAQILNLRPDLRTKVYQHLGQALEDTTRERLWEVARAEAAAGRLSHGRRRRAWLYFEADPAAARVRPVRPKVSVMDVVGAVLWALPPVLAAGYLGWVAILSQNLITIVAVLVALAASVIVVRDSFQWYYLTCRRQSKEHRRGSGPGNRPSSGPGERTGDAQSLPEAGFTHAVDRYVNHAFAVRRPNGCDGPSWLEETERVRRSLRDEIVEIYREQRISAEQVRWLIRHHANDTLRRWNDGTLYDYRGHLRVRRTTMVRCILSAVVMLVAWGAVVLAAFEMAWLWTLVAVIVGVVLGRPTVRRWYIITKDRRCYREDTTEAEENAAERVEALQHWTKKLEERPGEDLMAAWLSCDTTMLIDEALQSYGMSWREVVAHALLRAPATGRVRGRTADGPWRYSRYALRLFLFTADGVREYSRDLDFMRGEFVGSPRRNHHSFESIDLVQCADDRTIRVTLGSGVTTEISVTEGMEIGEYVGPVAGHGRDLSDPGNPEGAGAVDARRLEMLRANLEAAGFAHARYIFEGVGAGGKDWLYRDSGLVQPRRVQVLPAPSRSPGSRATVRKRPPAGRITA